MKYWSWILAAIGTTGIFLVGRKNAWAWLFLIFNECLWVVYSLVSHQYGFIFASIAYSAVYIKNYWHWTKDN